MSAISPLITPRLRLRTWTDGDRDNFAAMNNDPEVMHDLGGPISRAESDRKLDSYAASFTAHGYSRWLIEMIDKTGGGYTFIGYAGVHHRDDPDYPLGRHDDIGWRLTRSEWGNGYATEAARAALTDVFSRVGLREVVSYTAPDNLRSQAVMDRVGLVRNPDRDFTSHYPDVGSWTGLVWSASAPTQAPRQARPGEQLGGRNS